MRKRVNILSNVCGYFITLNSLKHRSLDLRKLLLAHKFPLHLSILYKTLHFFFLYYSLLYLFFNKECKYNSVHGKMTFAKNMHSILHLSLELQEKKGGYFSSANRRKFCLTSFRPRFGFGMWEYAISPGFLPSS